MCHYTYYDTLMVVPIGWMNLGKSQSNWKNQSKDLKWNVFSDYDSNLESGYCYIIAEKKMVIVFTLSITITTFGSTFLGIVVWFSREVPWLSLNRQSALTQDILSLILKVDQKQEYIKLIPKLWYSYKGGRTVVQW